MAFSQLKNFEKAVEFHSKAIEICPDSPIYRHERGKCYLLISNFEMALEDLNLTIQKQPTNSLAYYARGFAYKVKFTRI